MDVGRCACFWCIKEVGVDDGEVWFSYLACSSEVVGRNRVRRSTGVADSPALRSGFDATSAVLSLAGTANGRSKGKSNCTRRSTCTPRNSGRGRSLGFVSRCGRRVRNLPKSGRSNATHRNRSCNRYNGRVQTLDYGTTPSYTFSRPSIVGSNRHKTSTVSLGLTET